MKQGFVRILIDFDSAWSVSPSVGMLLSKSIKNGLLREGGTFTGRRDFYGKEGLLGEGGTRKERQGGNRDKEERGGKERQEERRDEEKGETRRRERRGKGRD